MSRTQRFGLLGIAAVIAIVAAVIIIATSGGDDSSTDSAGAVIEVKDAKPVGGVQTLTYKKGGTIDFTVKSDTADEIHFHGYDVGKDVDAGGSVQFKVPATIDGEFEVELEEHKEQIANVKVEP
jgi:hypothetical protein